MTDDALAARLRATFATELDEQTRIMSADLLVLEHDPANSDRLKSLFRVAHTLKGAARAVGEAIIERTCHEVESLLTLVRDGTVKLGERHIRLLFRAADALTDSAASLTAGHQLDNSPLLEIERGLQSLHGVLPTFMDEPPTRPEDPPAPAPTPIAPAVAGVQQLRVSAHKVDAVLAATEDLRVAAGQIAVRLAEVGGLEDQAAVARAALTRVANGLRGPMERDGQPTSDVKAALDLTERSLRGLAQEAARLTVSARASSRQLDRVVSAALDDASRLRMRPFGEICEGLPRVVRDLSVDQKKEVQLQITGSEAEADRAVLDVLREPLLHLVRNSIDHGLETPAVRTAAGKPARGTITIEAFLRGDRLIIKVADDGAGVDARALRRRLAKAGRSVTDDAALARVLFESGISARDATSDISGRGVGLDIVRTALESVGGQVDVEWTAGRGTTFTLDCPLTVASLRAVLVVCGGHSIAIPTSHVERMLRVDRSQLRRAESREVLPLNGDVIPVARLSTLLDLPGVAAANDKIIPAVLLSSADRRLIVLVDELLDERELTARPVDRGRVSLPMVSGASILPTGDIAPVLNVPAVLAEGLRAGAEEHDAPRAAAPTRRHILVVDDSITTRVLEQSVLEAAGYEVTTAVDGAEAWRILHDLGADLVVSDVEMPVLDGISLCERLRSSARFARLPVILVTGLESEAERTRGLNAGADAYLLKSTFDERTLLDTVAELLA
jgi:two-component system chemotaxis sensor kinase CheA